MKVLHLINGEFYAGAERVQDTLAQTLPQLGCSIDFACLKAGIFKKSRHALTSRVFEVEMRSRLDLSPALRVGRLLREGGYDLLHTHTPRSAMLGSIAARLAGRMMLHHIHGPTSISVGTAVRDAGNRMAERFGMTRAGRIIVVSRALGTTLERMGIARDRIRVVANGVPPNREAADWRPPSARWTIGVVALFRPRKGIEVVLEAVQLLRRRGYDVGVRAVGPFEHEAYRQSVLELAQQLNVHEYVEWVGFSHDVRAELQRVDLFAFPSVLGEGAPMALIEALAAGLPVVASAVEGVTEVLDPEGAGILVKPGMPAELADAIASLIDRPEAAEAMARLGRARHADRYSEDAMARSVLDIYHEVLCAQHRTSRKSALSQ